jgi:hypothetical protein
MELAAVRAWYLKQSFQLFWTYMQPWRARQHLLKWMSSAMRSKLEPFKKFVRMLLSPGWGPRLDPNPAFERSC